MKRKQKSIRKIKLLVLLMLMTIILSITATYAWFSTQRDVEITGMRLNIEVAESMQISLDGENWLQSIVIEDMKQFYGTYNNSLAHQAVKIADGTNLNYVPKELLPVSSDGTVTEGKLQFVKGTILGSSLTEISACSEDDITEDATIAEREDENEAHPYLVFDMYLRNISAKEADEVDILKLNEGSRVWVNTSGTTDKEGVGTENTGLEYSARVGLVLYGNTVDVTSTSGTISEDVRTIEPDGNETAAIWEPNNFEHTPYVVANNGMGITSTSEYVLTYAIKSTITGSVDNIYDITDTTNLSPVYTNIPQYNELGETMYEEYFTTVEGTSQIGLKPNAISKVRVYIWLEGQDPDCVDLASTGDKLNVELRLTKDENELRDEVTYDEETQLETEPGTILTASEVRAVDYGKYLVEYELANVTNEELGIGGWKIFHSDGTNIYLIADDYIYSEAFQLSDIANDIGYMDSYDINSELKAQWLRKYTYLSGMENIKATALLLDAWYWEDSFGKNNDTEYIIGGPTLELFTASYNATHSERKIRTKVSDYTGYTVRWNDGDWDDYIEGVDSLEGLYIINDTTKAEGMWIASPYADSDNLLPQETGINMAVARRFRNRRGKM